MLRARRKAVLLLAAAAAIVAIVVVGVLQSTGSGNDLDPLSAGEVRSGIADAGAVPGPIAAVHAQAGRLLDGGQHALDARLRALRGHPVVINVWGSWCGPCRAEFPIFQRAAIATASRVAFLGVDTQDARDDAARFLRSEPVPYPSYLDLKGRIASHYGLINTPSTIFVNRDGHMSIKQGVYTKLDDLEHDIAHFAERA